MKHTESFMGLAVGTTVWIAGIHEARVIQVNRGGQFPISVKLQDTGGYVDVSTDGETFNPNEKCYSTRPVLTPGTRIVRKQITRWATVGPYGAAISTYENETEARRFVQSNPSWRIVPLVGTYEVEVEG